VIVGDIGYRDHMVFTALGDAVNVAARLQDMTKILACEAVVSDEVRATAGLAADALPQLEVASAVATSRWWSARLRIREPCQRWSATCRSRRLEAHNCGVGKGALFAPCPPSLRVHVVGMVGTLRFAHPTISPASLRAKRSNPSCRAKKE